MPTKLTTEKCTALLETLVSGAGRPIRKTDKEDGRVYESRFRVGEWDIEVVVRTSMAHTIIETISFFDPDPQIDCGVVFHRQGGRRTLREIGGESEEVARGLLIRIHQDYLRELGRQHHSLSWVHARAG
ncbi:hypothetical protein HYX70_02880 [Candidatus Saccharibacteria bacterium]|nr:hypothetical protein [Candidatus Saccharibacteria bacterium]